MLPALRTMGKRIMSIADVAEEMNLLLVQEQGRGDAVDRRVAPALVVKVPGVFERVEVGCVGGGTEEVQRGDLEV